MTTKEIEDYLLEYGVVFYFNENYPEEMAEIKDVFWLPDYGIVFDHLKRLTYNEKKELELNQLKVYIPRSIKEITNFLKY